MTKKQKCMYNAYKQAENFSELWQVYGSYSNAKANAIEYCKRLQADKNGYAGKIVSHNGWIFTYGFLIRGLAMSQGFYGRLEEAIDELTEEARDALFDEWEDLCFADTVDFVLWIEG